MQALRVLGMLAEASPSVPSSRARLWPSIRVALEGLGVPMAAVSRCKQLALQVCGAALLLVAGMEYGAVTIGHNS